LFTVQELRICPGREQEFVERFRALDVLALAGQASNLVEAVLVRRDDRFEVVSVWASTSGIDAWVASAERVRVREELEPLYAEAPVVNTFEVLSRYSATRSST
jgi:heme-degrading monooxygenase HmoA